MISHKNIKFLCPKKWQDFFWRNWAVKQTILESVLDRSKINLKMKYIIIIIIHFHIFYRKQMLTGSNRENLLHIMFRYSLTYKYVSFDLCIYIFFFSTYSVSKLVSPLNISSLIIVNAFPVRSLKYKK